MKKLSTLFLCCSLLGVVALTACNKEKKENNEETVDGSKGLRYVLKEDGYYVDDIGNCKDIEIVIPSKYKGADVVGINDNAFFITMDVTKITIPNTVKKIGDSAFDYCDDLETIEFGEGSNLEFIGESAFANCGDLTNITIPDTVKTIGRRAFYDCYSLKNIEIPSSVTCIEDYTFKSCWDFTSITIPNSITDFGKCVFSGCHSLTNVTFEDDCKIESIPY